MYFIHVKCYQRGTQYEQDTWDPHCGNLWWNFHDFKKSLGFSRLPKGTTAQASLLGMLPPASIHSWVPVMQGWMRDGHTYPPQCRHTENSRYTQEYSLEPDGRMFKIVDVKEPAQKDIQTRRKNRPGPSVTARMCYSPGLKSWPDFLLSVLPRQSRVPGLVFTGWSSCPLPF